MTVFGVTTLLNVTDFLPTAFWITATYSLLFSPANSENVDYPQTIQIINSTKTY